MLFLAVVCCFSLSFVSSRPDFPPLAHTGGFGEPTCAACHAGDPVNTGGGSLSIDGVPATWRAGRTYRIVVTLRRDGLARGGFEIAARFPDGRQAGRFAATDSSARVSTDTTTRLEYAHHTLSGTRAAVRASAARWILSWTAPASGPASIVFDAAAVASNDDDSNLGDFVHTARARSRRP